MRGGYAAALALVVVTTAGCSGAARPAADPPVLSAAAPGDADPLGRILTSHPGLRQVVAEAPRYRFQAVLGLLEETPEGKRRLVQHSFRADAEYLYPASTVKLFAAVAALERLAMLRHETGLAIDADTPLAFHPLFAGEELEDRDPANLAGGDLTVRAEIRKALVVSDNAAFNRLYELAGPDGIAASLAAAGLAEGWIVHRLSESRTPEENLRLPRIDFRSAGFTHTLPQRTASPVPAPSPPPAGLAVGSGWIDGEGREVAGPMDFAAKNRFPLAALQRGLCMVVLAEVDCGGSGFTLAAADRELLAAALGELPRESANPRFDAAEHPDESTRPLLPGLRRVVPADRLRVYDKYGQAYGFTLTNSWVVDRAGGGSFFLAAALYTNSDGVLNDDRYDYETVALPFLADLGEATARALLTPPAAE